MRFRFCGQLDCPDWVLAEISMLSKLSSVKVKLLLVQVINDIIGKPIDYAKVEKYTSDAKFDLADKKACIAAMNFVVRSSAKYSVTPDILTDELQQLGLPKEHANSICRAYGDKIEQLQEVARENTLKVGQVLNIDYRVKYVLGSSMLASVREPMVEVGLAVQQANQTKNVAFSMTAEKCRLLLAELKEARSLMTSA